MHIVSHGFPATPPTECVVKLTQLVQAGKLKSFEAASHGLQVGSYICSQLAAKNEPVANGDLIILAQSGEDAAFNAALENLVVALGGDPADSQLAAAEAVSFPIPPFVVNLLIQQIIALVLAKLQSEGGIQAILDLIIEAISKVTK